MSNEMKKERRMIIKPLEVRVAGDDGQLPTIEGYAAVYNETTVIGGMFAERIMPGAANLSLADPGSIVIACFNHDDQDVPLARYKGGSGTLTLREDSKGLFVSFVPANTQLGRDVVESVRRGDTDGMSIGFYVMDDDWSGTYNGMSLRTITRIELADICLTPMPAYDSTTVALRTKRTNDEFTEADYRALLGSKNQQTQIEAEQRSRQLRLVQISSQ